MQKSSLVVVNNPPWIWAIWLVEIWIWTNQIAEIQRPGVCDQIDEQEEIGV